MTVDIQDYLPMASEVSRRWARSYPPVEQGDIFGELSLFLVEYQGLLGEYEGGVVRRLLEREATKYCLVERSARLHRDDQYFYRPDDVRAMLPYLFVDEVAGIELPWDYRATHSHSDALIAAIEMRRGFIQLRPEYQALLKAGYETPPTPSPSGEPSFDWDAIGEATGRSSASAHRAYYRAVEALTTVLNRTYTKEKLNVGEL